MISSNCFYSALDGDYDFKLAELDPYTSAFHFVKHRCFFLINTFSGVCLMTYLVIFVFFGSASAHFL